MRKFLLFISVLLIVIGLVPVTSAQEEETFALTVMHTDDTHAKHTPLVGANGGVAIQAAVVNMVRASVENSLLVDAGDRFSGSLYHTVHQGQDQVQIMNALGYDAMTLGNHEFDNGDDVLAAFVDGLDFPVVSTNIDASASPVLAGKFVPSVVLDVNGQQVGIIGLTTAEAPEISSPGEELVFNADYTTVVQAAVDELAAQGVNKIILLSHLGLDADSALAPTLAGVDLIVGGHSHSLLSNLYAQVPLSSPVTAAGAYPLEFAGTDGSPVYVVHAYSDNLFMGRIDLEFDAEGIVTAASGDTIYLSEYIAPDPALAQLVTDLSDEVELLKATPVETADGQLVESAVDLVGERTVCRVEECNLGNLIADSMKAVTGTQIALMNGGGVRASIDVGEITYGEVLTTLPFNNSVSIFEIDGANLLAALENGVSQIALDDNGMVKRDGAAGRFLQVSGMRYSYDPTQEPGKRIVSAEILNEDGTYSAIDPAAMYTVSTLNFLRTGGDGFVMFAENSVNPYDSFGSDYQLFADYLATVSPIDIGVEGRVTIVNAEVAPQ